MLIGLPLSTALTPRAKPSVVVMATVRTQSLPRCCCTSHTRDPPSRSISTALKIAGSCPDGNSMSTTGPVIAMTLPVAPPAVLGFSGDAMAMGNGSSRSGGVRAGGDLDHFAGDVCLANLVVGQRQVLDQFLCVLSGVAHRDHLGRLLARGQLQDGLVEPRRNVSGQELAEHRVGARLEDELAAGDPVRVLARLDRQEPLDRRALVERGNEL